MGEFCVLIYAGTEGFFRVADLQSYHYLKTILMEEAHDEKIP